MSGGQVATFGQGFVSVAGGITLALVGSAATCSQGTITGGSHGQVLTISQGSVGWNYSFALTGQASTTGAGTLVATGQQPALTGQGVTSGQGTLSPGGPPLTVNITGSEITSTLGLVQGGYQFLSGTAITVAQGTPVLSRTMPLSGSESVFSAGTVAVDQAADDTRIVSDLGSVAGWSAAVALLGTEATSAQGTIGTTGDITLPLAGQDSTPAAGTLGFEQAYPITGSEITSAQSFVGAPGGAALTGSEVAVVAGDVHTTNDRDFALTGQSITVQDGLAVTSYLAFATGQVLSVGQAQIGPVNATLTGIAIAVRQGVVTPPDVRPPGGGGGHGHGHGPKKPPPPRGHGKHRIKEAEITGDVLEVPLEDGSTLPVVPLTPIQRNDDDEDEAFLLL